ncbi:MAG: hypothetical protein ACXW4B_10085 [Micavibrio sp.]
MSLSAMADDLLRYLSDKGYICPWGKAWHDLWLLLPEDFASQARAAPPLILTGWYYSTNLVKIMRMREHIEWADRTGAITQVDKYLRGLPDTVWHTYNNSPYPCGS